MTIRTNRKRLDPDSNQMRFTPFRIGFAAFILIALSAGIVVVFFDKPQEDKQAAAIIHAPATVHIPQEPSPELANKSLTVFCKKYAVDPALVIKNLAFKGIAMNPESTLNTTAQQNNLNFSTLYTMIREAALSQKQ
ncbi:MAG: hypothetical protein MI892_11405 [Desulfobacterales bacterium]|nr:hypothetical protein [Desulfobacterales bacterium]